MNTKHTPGPWVAKFEEAYYVTGPDLGRVAMMMNLKGAHGLSGRRSGEESAANARLIAAAPELLEAVRNFIAYDDSASQDGFEFMALYSKAVDAARAAIAKATGSAT